MYPNILMLSVLLSHTHISQLQRTVAIQFLCWYTLVRILAQVKEVSFLDCSKPWNVANGY
jgi:hypothetical protein